MLLVGLGLVDLASLDQLDDPSRVEIDHEADAAAVLAEVLDGQTQTSRAAGPDHDPVGAARKEFVGKRLAEGLVVDAEVVDVDAGFGDTGAAAGFKCVDGVAGIGFGHPTADGTSAQPLVLKKAEAIEVF